MKHTKKLTQDELEMAVQVLYAHYGKYFVENAEDLAKTVSEEFDCNCTEQEVYKYVNVRIVEEEDRYLLMRNIFE